MGAQRTLFVHIGYTMFRIVIGLGAGDGGRRAIGMLMAASGGPRPSRCRS